ncbi:MFS transporter [Saccharothrix violaceirubra]|uniref:MFS family permease n=1 Tax=Saccharothrix violaceirubra TaxID=413306 RepID=A0A7W7T399_9PSEU|nr:MFS transporter [Saccharothrix violaceirubra]MBB4964560.1 MFS family permease [Saccharothrix violaceirubra]
MSDPWFSRLWAASTATMLGDGIRVAGLPLLTAASTGSPTAVSLVAVAVHLPWLLFSLFGGVLVDRFDRARLLWLSGVAQAVLVGGLAVLVHRHPPGLVTLVVLAALLGCAGTVHLTASGALLPELVEADELDRAHGRLQGSQVAARQLLGPLLGAVVFGFAVWLPFAIDAALFLLAAVLVRPLVGSNDRTRAEDRVFAETRSGVLWLSRHKGFRLLAVGLGVAALALQLGTTLLVLLVTGTLRGSVAAFGIVLAVGAVGGVVGGVTAGRLRARLGLAAALSGALLVMGVSLLVVGVSGSVAVVAVMCGFGGFGAVVWTVQASALWQRVLPRTLRTRVGGVYRLIGWAGVPVGAALSGALATVTTLRVPFLVGGVLLLLTTALVPALARLDATPTPVPNPQLN